MKNNKGFTLVEVIISLAIVGIVTLAIFSFFSFNINSFNKSAEAMEEQSNLRLASLKLTNELRNIGFIDLANHSFANTSEISSISTSDNFIYDDGNNIKKGNSSSIINFAEDEIKNVLFSLKEENERFFLNIEVVGDKNSYSTDVFLNNIITKDSETDGTLIQMDSTDIGAGTFTSIQYNYDKPPLDYMSSSGGSSGSGGSGGTELTLDYPPTEIEKGTEFYYKAQAEGGTAPYFYTISVDTSVTDLPAPVVNPPEITWSAPNGNGKKLRFSVIVTDSTEGTPLTLTATFTVTTTN